MTEFPQISVGSSAKDIEVVNKTQKIISTLNFVSFFNAGTLLITKC